MVPCKSDVRPSNRKLSPYVAVTATSNNDCVVLLVTRIWYVVSLPVFNGSAVSATDTDSGLAAGVAGTVAAPPGGRLAGDDLQTFFVVQRIESVGRHRDAITSAR